MHQKLVKPRSYNRVQNNVLWIVLRAIRSEKNDIFSKIYGDPNLSNGDWIGGKWKWKDQEKN